MSTIYKIDLNDASMRGILKNSLPMMISALSSHLMLLLDQFVLARYSIEAMTGANAAFLWSSVIQCLTLSTTMVAGVFAGHYRGAEKYEMAGKPVWQMMYFSIMLFVISVPIAFLLGQHCIPEPLQKTGIPYFKLIMTFAPITGIIYSLSSFFVSIGKGTIVTISVTISNIVNLLLDIVFVFGWFGITCFEGSLGAAAGTVLSWITNLSVLLCFFFEKNMRVKYHTTDNKISFDLMKKCLQLGFWGGVGHIFEMSARSILYYMLANVSTKFAAIQTMAFSVNILLSFIASGLEKGMMAMTANFLGAKRKHKIQKLLRRGVGIQLCVIAALFTVFYIFPEIIIAQFIKFDNSSETMNTAVFVLKLVWLFYVFDSILWVIAGVIEAGGDINYTMCGIAFSLWGIVATPAMILYKYELLSIERVWYLLTISAAAMALLLYMRYKSGKWIKIIC